MKAMEPNPDRHGEVIEEPITLREDDMRTKVIKIVKDVTKK